MGKYGGVNCQQGERVSFFENPPFWMPLLAMALGMLSAGPKTLAATSAEGVKDS